MVRQKFNMLTVVQENVGRSASGNKQVLCRCDCGVAKVYRQIDVELGKVKSCGCLRRSGDSYRKHGHKPKNGAPSRVYTAWRQMRDRCTNPKAENYGYYGGRGIVVCERWDRFEDFLADMGEPLEGMSLDRIDVNGNYEPNNCRWADRVTQMNNCRNTVQIEIDGRSQTFSEWAAELGIARNTLRQRYYRTGRIA